MRRGFGGGSAANGIGTATGTSLTLTSFLVDGGRKALASQFSKSGASAGTVATVTGMSIALTAGSVYAFRGGLKYTCVAGVGIKFQMTASGGLTAAAYALEFYDYEDVLAGVSVAAPLLTLGGGTSVIGATPASQEASYATFEGSIKVTNAGTINLQFGSGANNQTATLEVGTWMIFDKIA